MVNQYQKMDHVENPGCHEATTLGMVSFWKIRWDFSNSRFFLEVWRAFGWPTLTRPTSLWMDGPWQWLAPWTTRHRRCSKMSRLLRHLDNRSSTSQLAAGWGQIPQLGNNAEKSPGLEIYHESVLGRCELFLGGRFLDRTKISWHKRTEMCGPSVFKLMFNEPAVTMCTEMARQNFNCPIHESRHSHSHGMVRLEFLWLVLWNIVYFP